MAFATPKRSKTNEIISKFNSAAATTRPTALQQQHQGQKRPPAKLNETPVNSKCRKQDLTTTISTSQHHDANQITVAVRIRPLDSKESAAGHFNAVKRLNETSNQIMVVMPDNNRAGGSSKQPPLTFPCDIIITDQVSSQDETNTEQNGQQQYVYERLGKPLLDQAFDGYNVSIFAYGQTGSGKTYSMIGTQSEPGLIPRFFDQLFARINDNTKENYCDDEITRSTHVEISYYEIYNEKIYDLLRSTDTPSTQGGKKTANVNSGNMNGRNLQIREDPQTGPFIVDLQTLSASTSADAQLWMDIGNKRRATACTNMNQKSSRSHSVFQITLTQMVEQKQSSSGSTTGVNGEQKLLQLVTSKINLVDLAGSERINSSFNPNTPMTTSVGASQRLKESTCINKSLLTLGKIICQLAERQQHHHNASAADLASSSNSSNNQNAAMIVNTPTPANNGSGSNSAQLHLPYRESTLTWLLKESLGGNAKTAMLATVCASSAYVDETVCTLRYATKTASIKTAAHLNCNYRRKYIDEYGRENEITLLLPPMSALDSNSLFLKQQQRHQQLMEEQSQKHEVLEKRAGELEQTLKSMEVEWREKLARAEIIKQKEIADMEKSLIALYGNETCSRNCCLINLNEDPSLSEKLIYLLKADVNTTLIGSDKSKADIHLSSALVASQHARIIKESTDDESYFIEHLGENYVTYLNGDMLVTNVKYKLAHGDRIIFGGSMFFRFNNPSVKNTTGNAATTTASHQFKDYQFAKNEIEKKQNELIQKRLDEALSKCKEDGEEKLNQLKQEYEKVKNDLEREKIERKIELQKMKIHNQKKLRQIEQKKIIEANLNMVQSEMAAVSKEIDAQEKELLHVTHNETVSDLNSTSSSTATTNTTDTMASSCRTPFVNKRLLNMLYSDKKTTVKATNQHDLIQTHTNSNSLFAITLHVTEANKICHSLGLEYEFKRFEVNGGARGSNSQAVCVVDKRLNLITLWNMETFENKLNLLRETYERYMDGEDDTNPSESLFLTDSLDEWQTLEAFHRADSAFSPRVIENAMGRGFGEKKSLKRRLSMLSMKNLHHAVAPVVADSSLVILDDEMLDECDKSQTDDVIEIESKNKPIQMPTSANEELDMKTTSEICNQYVFATCRDALNDLEFEFDDDEEEEVSSMETAVNAKNKKIESDSLPSTEDSFVSYYARLLIYVNKLIELYQKSTTSMSEPMQGDLDCQNNAALVISNQPLYCIKILMIYSQLSQFRIDNWSLCYGHDPAKLIELYARMRKLIKKVKESINFMLQSVENNIETMTKSRYEMIENHVAQLFNLHGQFVLLSCSNKFLKTDNYSLTSIDIKYIEEYASGVETQYADYFQIKLAQYQAINPGLVELLKHIEAYRIEYREIMENEEEEEKSHEVIIDYCNHLLQANYRLAGVCKRIDSYQKLNDPNIRKSLSSAIINQLYTLIIDMLTLNKNNVEANQKWSETFMSTLKLAHSHFKSSIQSISC